MMATKATGFLSLLGYLLRLLAELVIVVSRTSNLRRLKVHFVNRSWQRQWQLERDDVERFKARTRS